MVLSPLGRAGWGSHPPPSTVSVGFPQALPGHGAGCQVSIRLGTALGTWHCRDPGLRCGGLPMAPPTARPRPPSCAGRGEPGEGGAGRTVYVCWCQVLAGHRASRAGAQLLNPLRPPHTLPARDQARPTLLGWSPCTPTRPETPPSQHSTGAAVARRVRGSRPALLPWVLVGRRSCCPEELPWDHVPPQPPAHNCSPDEHPKCGSWVSQTGIVGVQTELQSQSPPRSAVWGQGPCSPSAGPVLTRPDAFSSSPRRSWTRPGASWNPAPRSSPVENVAAGPGPNPATRNLPARPGVAPGSGWTDARTGRSDHSQGQQQWGWWGI